MTLRVTRRRLVSVAVPVVLVGGLVAGFHLELRPSEPNVDPRRYDGTQAMAERLKEHAAELTAEVILRVSQPTTGLRRYFREIKQPPDERSRVLLEAKKATLLLAEGKTGEAIERYQ